MMQRHKPTQKRIAADLLRCGTSRIWMDPAAAAKIAAAITRADVRRLIESGAIAKLPPTGRGAAGKRRYQRQGSRRGAKAARQGKKEAWFKIIRPQRQLLREHKGSLAEHAYRKAYRMVKGGTFRSRAHLQSFLQAKGMIVKRKVKHAS